MFIYKLFHLNKDVYIDTNYLYKYSLIIFITNELNTNFVKPI